ncbi:MAG: porin [Gemmataceae bacterium]
MGAPLGDPIADDESTSPPKSESVSSVKEASGLLDTKDDAKPKIDLRGRINADAIVVHQSARDLAIVGEVPSATGFRRARLGAEGTVGEQVNWVAEFDFARGTISFKDVYVGVDRLPLLCRVRLGHMLEPFSLEGYTSSNFITFMERSSVNALSPGRNWGAGVFAFSEDERVVFQIGAFRPGTGSNGDDIGNGNDIAFTTRLTGLPWLSADGRSFVHLGAAFSQRRPPNDLVTINLGPQNTLLTVEDTPGSPFQPVITIPASAQQLYNLQGALVLGPLSLQAEWTATDIDQIGGPTVFLNGGYAFVSYFLTGESRAYLRQDGKFGMTRVLEPFVCLRDGINHVRGPGAWEVAARFGYVNFSSGAIPRNANGLRVGDTETTLTLGLNWYLNDYTRLMFNYTHAIPVDPNFGPSFADSYGLRVAIFW